MKALYKMFFLFSYETVSYDEPRLKSHLAMSSTSDQSEAKAEAAQLLAEERIACIKRLQSRCDR